MVCPFQRVEQWDNGQMDTVPMLCSEECALFDHRYQPGQCVLCSAVDELKVIADRIAQRK